MIKRIAKVSGLAALSLLAIVILLALVPAGSGDLQPAADPADGYAEAERRVSEIQAGEEGRVCDECGTRLYSHGGRTDAVVVLIHGLSNSPRQFQEMGEQLYMAGYNVYIPRMPYHGLASHDVSELSRIRVNDLVGYADESVDIAAGLGDRVIVAGLSGGGSVVAWVAQNRGDVDKAVLIAPLVGIKQLPGFANGLFVNLFTRLPGIDMASPSEPEREHVYRGQSSRGVAEYLLLARGVVGQAREAPPAVDDITVIINGADDQVNNGMVESLAERWRGSGATITTYEFPGELGLPHDVIDVSNPDADTQVTYPAIIGLIES